MERNKKVFLEERLDNTLLRKVPIKNISFHEDHQFNYYAIYSTVEIPRSTFDSLINEVHFMKYGDWIECKSLKSGIRFKTDEFWTFSNSLNMNSLIEEREWWIKKIDKRELYAGFFIDSNPYQWVNIEQNWDGKMIIYWSSGVAYLFIEKLMFMR
ncbi:hypothetical protein [Reichenbachiella sp.]